MEEINIDGVFLDLMANGSREEGDVSVTGSCHDKSNIFRADIIVREKDISKHIGVSVLERAPF